MEDSDLIGGRYYTNKRALGEGASAQVALGVDNANKTKVAIKHAKHSTYIFSNVLNEKRPCCLKAAMRTYREIRILRHLSHFNVVELKDVVSEKLQSNPDKLRQFVHGNQCNYTDEQIFSQLDDIFLIFSYASTDLYKIFSSEIYFTMADVQSIFYQVLLGMKHMHSANVIHRDIKPENILICRVRSTISESGWDYRARIADLGLARVVDTDDIILKTESEIEAEYIKQQKKTAALSLRDVNITFHDAALHPELEGDHQVAATSTFTHSVERTLSKMALAAQHSVHSIASALNPSLHKRVSDANNNKGANMDDSVHGEKSLRTIIEEHHDRPIDDFDRNTLGTPQPLVPPLVPPPTGGQEDLGPPLSARSRNSANIALFRQYSDHVISRWYRAPEVVCCEHYTSSVDIWSTACVLFDMLNMVKELVNVVACRRSLFQGAKASGKLSPDGINTNPDEGKLSAKESEDNTLHDPAGKGILSAILNLLGTPELKECGHLQPATLRQLQEFPPTKKTPLKSFFPPINMLSHTFDVTLFEMSLQLLQEMLTFDPYERISAGRALNHAFLRSIYDPAEEEETLCLNPLNGEQEAELESTENLCNSLVKELLYFHDHNDQQDWLHPK